MNIQSYLLHAKLDFQNQSFFHKIHMVVEHLSMYQYNCCIHLLHGY